MELGLNVFGYLGGILLAFCAIPEVILAYKKKDSGLSWTFLLMWLFGEIFVLIPVVLKIKVGFLLLNYTLNCILILVICYYKRFGRKLTN